MSQITRAIRYVEHSVNFLDMCERLTGDLRPELERRRDHARRRLSVLYRQRSEENREIARTLHVFNVMSRPNPRPVSMLVPRSPDESLEADNRRHVWAEGAEPEKSLAKHL